MRRDLLVRALALGVGAFLALVVSEIGLRLAGVSYPRLYQRDDMLGAVRVPNLSYWHTDEGRALVEINSVGYRDIERAISKPAGTVRVALIGDSFTAGMGVSREERFGELADSALGPGVEVLNFGVEDYGTAQELIVLREHVWDYDPDVVVLVVFPANDWVNNHEPLQGQDNRPYFLLEDGRLVLDKSFRTSPGHIQSTGERLAFWFIDRLRLGQVAYRTYVDLWAVRAAGQTSEPGVSAVPSRYEAVMAPPRDTIWEDAWDVTEALFVQFAEDVAARGVPFLLMSVPKAPQAHPDESVRRSVETRLGVEDLFYAERRMEALGARHGFPVLTLAEHFQARARETGVYYYGFENSELGSGHWNADGHRLAAESLVPVLRELLDER